MKVVAWTLVAVAGFLGVSLWSFWLTVRPPRILIPDTPRGYRLPFDDITITTDDGLRLAAWLIPRGGAPLASGGPPTPARAVTAAAPRHGAERPARRDGEGAAVILLHGYPAEKADMLPIAAALHPELTTLLVDLRYFGKSEGRATTLGHRERRDLARAVDLLAARGFTRVGVFGYSLGGAVALLGAAEDPRVRAVAAYAPFSDLRVLGRELYAGLWLLKYPLVETMALWTRLFLGADITRPSPAEAARRLAIPVLLMHNRADEQIPFSHAERLAKALAGNPRAEREFGRGLHNDRPADFERRLAEFFLKHLG